MAIDPEQAAIQINVTYTASHGHLTLMCNECEVEQVFTLKEYDVTSFISFPLVHLQTCSTKFIGGFPVEELT